MSQGSGFMGLLTGTLSRFIFALPFGAFGVFHFLGAKNMTFMVPAYIPGPPLVWVYITGGALVLACLSFITGQYTYLTGIGLGVMLLVFAFTVHLPVAMKGVGAAQVAGQVSMLKDVALAGAAFYMAGRAAY